MSTILHKTRRVQRQLALIVWLREITVFVAGLVLMLLILCGIDWTARLESTGLRWLLCFCFYATSGLLGFVLLQAVRRIPSLQNTALLLESADPKWQGELAAAVSFQTQFHSGSHPQPDNFQLISQLEQRVAVRLEDEQRLGISREKFLLWPILLVALLTLLTTVAVAFPGESYLATSRIVWPERSLSWPQRTRLRVLEKSLSPLASQQILVHGSRLVELYVLDEIDPPPAQITLETQLKDGTITTSTLKRETRKNSFGETVTVFPISITPQSGSVRFRAVAKDDQQMDWYVLTQVSPMYLSNWAMTLTSPAYLNLPVQKIEHQVGTLNVVIGSQLSIQGTTDRPFQRLRLEFGEENFELTRNLREFNVVVEVVEKDAKLVLRGAPTVEGISSNAFQSEPLKQLQVVGIEDQHPEIKPVNMQTSYQFTIEAVPEFRYEILDDYGIAEIELRAVSGLQSETIKTLGVTELQQTQIEFSTPVNLLSLQERLGSKFEISPRARDRRPTAAGVDGASILVEIVSQAQKQDELQHKFSDVIEFIQDIHDQQQRTLEHSTDLSIQYQKAQTLRPEDAVSLRTFSDGQSRIQQSIFGEHSGVLDRLQGVLNEWELNRLKKDGLYHLSLTLISQLDNDLSERLQSANAHFNTLIRLAPALVDSDHKASLIADPEQTFNSLIQNQQQIVLQLRSILNQLEQKQANTQHELSWNRLAQEFYTLVEATTSLAQQTITLDESSLSPQQRADLALLAEQHHRISEKVSLFSLADKEATPVLETIARILNDENVATLMQSVAEQLQTNNVAQAVETDHRLFKVFQNIEQQLGDTLSENPASQLSEAQEVLRHLEQTKLSEAELQQTFLLADPVDQELRNEFSTSQRELTQHFELLANFAIVQPHFTEMHLTLTTMRQLESDLESAPGSRVEMAFAKVATALEDLILKFQNTLNSAEQYAQTARRDVAGRIALELVLQQQQLRNETLSLQAELKTSSQFSRQQRRQFIELRERQEALLSRIDEIETNLPVSKIYEFVLARMENNLNRIIRLLNDESTSVELTQRQQHVSIALQNLAESFQKSSSEARSTDPGNADSQTNFLPEELQVLLQMQAHIIQREQDLLALPIENRDQQTLEEIAADQQAISKIVTEILTTPSNTDAP